jgi:NAD(P)-dependent dehydrogenase (short-subunit alcohol dehydrogenase family)
MKLHNKVALITGVSPNIGGGIAMGMADAGAQVVCVDVRPDNAARCAEAIKASRGILATARARVVCSISRARQPWNWRSTAFVSTA